MTDINDSTPRKECSKCGEEKLATSHNFNKDKTRRDGLYPQCRSCCHPDRKREILPEGQKRCAKCKQIYPATLEYFYPEKQHTDGLRSRCIPCAQEDGRSRAKQARRNPEKRHRINEQQRQRYYEYREEMLKRQLEYREKNRERIRKSDNDRYYERHDFFLERNRDYRQRERARAKKRRRENPEKERETLQRWRIRHYELSRQRERLYRQKPQAKLVRVATKARYRAKKNSLPNNFTVQDWLRCLEYFNHCCAVCGRQLRDLFDTHSPGADHWIPINDTRPDNPGTVAWNIIPLCHGRGGCNNSKHDVSPEQWLASKYPKRKAAEILDRIHRYFEWIKSQ